MHLLARVRGVVKGVTLVIACHRDHYSSSCACFAEIVGYSYRPFSWVRFLRVVRHAFKWCSVQVRRLDGMEVMEADRADAEQKYEEEVSSSELRL